MFRSAATGPNILEMLLILRMTSVVAALMPASFPVHQDDGPAQNAGPAEHRGRGQTLPAALLFGSYHLRT